MNPKQFHLTFLMIMALISGQYTWAQTLQTSQVRIIDNLSKNYKPASSKGFGKTNSCNTDTSNYPYYKATVLTVVALNNTSSGNVFAQWYDAQQPLTISGFDFFAWQSAGTNAVIPLNCKIYAANPQDSTPTGPALASVVVNVDSTFGGGTLATLKRKAVFASPVTINQPYILTVETSSSTNVSIVTNSWNANPPNGRNEWLSSVHFGNQSYYVRSYNVNVGGIQFNADFLYHPYVTYSLTADFNPTSMCNQGGNYIQFINSSSSVLFSRFYNTRAYYNITYISCKWEYGDTTGNWYAINGSHTYFYRAPYTVKLTDTIVGYTTGCADTRLISLNQAPPPVKANSNSPVCPGSAIKLYADTLPNATGYYWTGPNGFTSTAQHPVIPNATVAHQGTYSLVAVMGQCTTMVSLVNINLTNTPTVSSNSPVCVGQSLNLSTSGLPNATYAWTGPNNFSSTAQSPVRNNITQTDSGTYQLTITSPGCGTIGPLNVNVMVSPIPSAPVANSNSPVCTGELLQLSAAGAPGTYSWTGPNNFISSNQNTNRVNTQTSFAGQYEVVLTINGCASVPAITTVVVKTSPIAPVVSSNAPLCAGQSLSLSASLIANATYAWSGPNSFTSTVQNPVRSGISVIDAGTYSVVATLNGCNSPAANTTVVVTAATPTPVASSNAPLCPGQGLQLFASGITGATYSWSGPNNFTSSLQNPTIASVSASDSGVYSVTAATTGCGVSNAGNTLVKVNALPAAPIVTNSGPICDGDTLFLFASNIAGATYNWTGPDGFVSSQQNPLLSSVGPLQAGPYSAFVSVAGCGNSGTSTTNVFIHRIPQKPVISGNTALCDGDTLKLTASASGTGINASYSWTGPNNFSASQQTMIIDKAVPGNSGIYSVTVKDSGCTSGPSTLNAVVKTRPSAPLASNNGPVCIGNDIQLSASTVLGALYKWTGPNGYVSGMQSPILYGKNGYYNGTYFVTVSVNGCHSASGQTNVFQYPLPPDPMAGNDGPACVGAPVMLTCNPVPGVMYSWTGPLGFTADQQNPVINNTKTGMSGIYSVVLIDSHCVSNSGSTQVTIHPIPAPPVAYTYPTDGKVCAGDSMKMYATFISGVSYEWNGPGGFNSSLQSPTIQNVTPAESGTYQVTVSKNNCISSPVPVSFVVSPLPNTGQITGADSAFTSDTKAYSITGDSGSIFNWIAFGGAIQGAATGNLINVKWGNPGTGFVRTRETALSGCKGLLMQQNVIISKVPPSAIDEKLIQAGALYVYPVPANRKAVVGMRLPVAGSGSVSIYNMLGERITFLETEFNEGLQEYELNTETLQSGIYVVEVKQHHFTKQIKIQVSH